MNLRQFVGVTLIACAWLGGGSVDAEYYYSVPPASHSHTSYSVHQPQARAPYGVSHTQNSDRSHRSLYEHSPSSSGWATTGHHNDGWTGGALTSSPVGLGHITKDELITLLKAWRDAEKKPKRKSPKKKRPVEIVDDDDDEDDSDESTESDEEEDTTTTTTARPRRPRPTTERPPTATTAPPRPVAPISISVPALVPIQLSANFQSLGNQFAVVPQQTLATTGAVAVPGLGAAGAVGIGGAVGAAGVAGVAGVGGAGGDQAAAASENRPLIKPAIGFQQFIFRPLRQLQNEPKKFDLPNSSRNFASNNFGASKPRSFGPTLDFAGSSPQKVLSAPPPYVGSLPPHLKLVPSSQLLSNWQ